MARCGPLERKKMRFEYHPEVIDPKRFTPEWFGDRVADLLAEYWTEGAVYGFDRQYDRTIDEDGNPGEYIQVWMSWGEEDEGN